MRLIIKRCNSADQETWDDYVCHHLNGTLYHLFAWMDIIQSTYSHTPYYLMAVRINAEEGKHQEGEQSREKISGVLPLIHLKSIIFGNQLISMPYLDIGGILADDVEVENALIKEALKIGSHIGIELIEFRSQSASRWAKSGNSNEIIEPGKKTAIYTHQNKARMLLELPSSSEELMKGFKSKLRKIQCSN